MGANASIERGVEGVKDQFFMNQNRGREIQMALNVARAVRLKK